MNIDKKVAYGWGCYLGGTFLFFVALSAMPLMQQETNIILSNYVHVSLGFLLGTNFKMNMFSKPIFSWIVPLLAFV